ncbi:hypothetical protein HG536_0G00720 [Torulaspora globosa]|uniref:GAF domain-containing protein n=1 Tax=Torulaspora globosa TaxID=48254 RepID=A0A7G3ZL29_9SACH|nr:uncharacterized protein HG536_0G00720 [Torulaspora globosa]QLL34215.1 hypothetical protein HG536_0G00720 [Torulaspora globosa]
MPYHANYSSFTQNADKKEALQLVLDHYESLSTDQSNWICNLANASSLLWYAYKSLNVNVNWTGFYVAQPDQGAQNDETLLLGPFQGKVACQTIPFGKGVCGAAAATQETQLVSDVSKAAGHIACDGDTKSEIVVPIVDPQSRKTLAVIDIDCVDLNGFDEVDKFYLEKLARLICTSCNFNRV